MLIYGIQEWGEVQAESFYLDITSRIDTLKTNPNRVRENILRMAGKYGTLLW